MRTTTEMKPTPAAAARPPGSTPREGVKDTFESIIVAFIMAFVFRAFVVEAFVIPTGSMAPTLLGKHGTITCSDCGYEFDYGLADQSQNKQGSINDKDQAVCPNCRHRNSPLRINDVENNAESGDRILVLKWPYELGSEQLGPQRWDVTVFKDPADGTTNFIKRLVGLPNEILMIVDGDLYTVPTAELSDATRRVLDRYRSVKHRLLADERRGLAPDEAQMFQRPLDAAVLSELERKLRIRRKTDEAQGSLWSIVYDHDYPPRSRDDGQPYWAPLDGARSTWDALSRRVHVDGVGQPAQGLAFVGSMARAIPIADLYAYNVEAKRGPSRSIIHYPVSDLRLEFVLVPLSGGGALTLKLTKNRDAFWAGIGGDGQVSITHTDGRDPDGAEPLVQGQVEPFRAGQKRNVAFEIVDYRVRLFVDGRVVLETTPAQYAPDLRGARADWRQLREAVYRSPMLDDWATAVRATPAQEGPRIFAEDTNLELWHLTVHRDVYYTLVRPGHPITWASLGWGLDGNPIALGPDEYFMLGDNSPQSKDSRLWDKAGPHLQNRGEEFQLGTVPRDQLIGRAFFVYWPSGLRPEWLPFLGEFGIIPNVGRMRWIR